MKFQHKLFPIALLTLAALPVQADIFKCTDAEGHITYSNVALKSCKKLTLDPVPTGVPAKAASKTPTPATFPKVEESTQKARDTDRRRILETELSAEQQNLEQARKALAEQESLRSGDERNYQKVLDRLQPFKDKVALHERNIAAISREISNLR